MKRGIALALVVFVSVIAGGCGSDSRSASSRGGSAQGQKKVRVFVLMPSTETQAYLRQIKGMKHQQTKEPNAAVTIDAGDVRGSADVVLQKLQSAVTQRYDAIAVNAGANAKQMLPILKRAVDRGIKIVAFDQDLPGLTGKSTLIGWDSRKAGEIMGEYWRTKLLPDGGKVGVIRCFAGIGQLLDFEYEGWESTKGSKIKVVSTIDAQCDQAKARAAAENMLTAHPDLKGIFCDADYGALGAERALDAAGKKDIILTGAGSDEEALKTILNGGVLSATSTFPFELFGERAVHYAIEAARGKQLPPDMLVKPELVTSANAKGVLDGILNYPPS
jgi:ribose transport system substrate-binding protein